MKQNILFTVAARRLLCTAALLLPIIGAQAGVVLTTLHSFQLFTNGANPYAGLVHGSDGNFYGTTYNGGTNGDNGTVFKITTNGALTSLYSFTGGNDGAYPEGELVQGSDSYFYGTTFGGGWGTVFKISTNGTLTSLYSFTGGNDGAGPTAGLVQGSDGNFYGTTEIGGTPAGNGGHGTVFKITPNGVLTTLHSFIGGKDGDSPSALVQGSDGNFYGTTWDGGANYHGTVFKISPNGALTAFYTFGTPTNADGEPLDGANPYAPLVQGSDGYFYGTTGGGGTNGGAFGSGTVFKISPNGALTSLYSFTGGNDGATPEAGLVQGSDGYFYGTTVEGGTHNAGTVFKITTNGVLTTLHSFIGAGEDGDYPTADLVQGNDGNFYGTTENGGANEDGTVFKISTNGALTSLYSFTGTNYGEYPQADLVQGSDGDFYGTTSGGGTNGYGDGTVFKISANGVLTSLYSFTGANNGAIPYAGLVQGSDGILYGTTSSGGTYTNGTVFKISADGALTSLYSFTGGNDGANPYGGLVQGSDGFLYGTTYNGGASSNGTVFKISASGALTTLYGFGTVTYTNGYPLDGANPSAGLVQGNDGFLYGTTQFGGTTARRGDNDVGTVFKITTNGTLTTLYSFTAVPDGANPAAGLVQGSDGSFYGTTYNGGTVYDPLYRTVFKISPNGEPSAVPMGFAFLGYGTVFKITPNGVLTTLYSFTGTDGANPAAGLVEGSDGYFYGTTAGGGTNVYGYGTVFRISTNGALTTLYSFTGGNDGAEPFAGLVQGSDGSFYGTTEYSDQRGAGTVFRLTIVPEFQAVTLTNNTLNLTWSTETGARYQLQYTSDLSSSNWINLNSPATATGATLSTTDSLNNGPQRFYRLVLSP